MLKKVIPRRETTLVVHYWRRETPLVVQHSQRMEQLSCNNSQILIWQFKLVFFLNGVGTFLTSGRISDIEIILPDITNHIWNSKCQQNGCQVRDLFESLKMVTAMLYYVIFLMKNENQRSEAQWRPYLGDAAIHNPNHMARHGFLRTHLSYPHPA